MTAYAILLESTRLQILGNVPNPTHEGRSSDSHSRLLFGLLAKVGFEPTRLSALDFESSASAVPPLGL